MKKTFFSVWMALSFATGPFVQATTYVPSNIQDLSKGSAIACFGSVKSLRETSLNGKPVQELQFQCDESAKGNKGLYTLYMFDFSPAKGAVKFISKSFEAGPSFEIGKKYFVFFHQPHPQSGLTSPVGGPQGVFRYDSKLGLINGLENKNIAQSIQAEDISYKSAGLDQTLKALQNETRVGLSVDEMIRLVKASD
ncbi:MAG: hypothetical protein JNK65_09185 [Deltaproteobacteria bacterium]|nr:hypothetical protein [Deltaproteobacteria bacterium]